MRAHHLYFDRHQPRGASTPRLALGIVELARCAVDIVRTWFWRTRQRNELARLDTRLLRDIGVTPSEAESECAKPFWRR